MKLSNFLNRFFYLVPVLILTASFIATATLALAQSPGPSPSVTPMPSPAGSFNIPPEISQNTAGWPAFSGNMAVFMTGNSNGAALTAFKLGSTPPSGIPSASPSSPAITPSPSAKPSP